MVVSSYLLLKLFKSKKKNYNFEAPALIWIYIKTFQVKYCTKIQKNLRYN